MLEFIDERNKVEVLNFLIRKCLICKKKSRKKSNYCLSYLYSVCHRTNNGTTYVTFPLRPKKW